MSTEADNENARSDDSVSRAMTPAAPDRKTAERKSAQAAAPEASGAPSGAASASGQASARTSGSASGQSDGASSARNDRPSHRRGSAAGTALATAALVVALGTAAAAYYAWRDIGIRTAAGDAALRGFDDRLGEFGRRIDAGSSAIVERDRREESLRADIAEIDRRLNDAQEAQTSLREEIRAALDAFNRPAMEPVDVERLLLIANDALALQREPDVALAALRIADRRLATLGDPAYTGVRRELAGEIAALESAPRTDIAGIAYGLAAMQTQLPGLEPRFGPERRGTDGAEPEAPAEAPADAAPPPRWQTFFSDLWHTLRGLVVIRRTAPQEGPLLAPEQHDALVQNIELRLASARLAALGGDQENFRLDVLQARDWLQRYYGTDQPAAAKLIERLDEFAAVELHPALPEISGSLTALRAVMQRRTDAKPSPEKSSPELQRPSQPAPEAPAEPAASTQ